MVAAIAGLAVSAYGAYSSSQSASDATSAQTNAANQQAQVAQNQLDFGKQQYADYQKTFQPGLDQLGKLASAAVTPDYGAINADVGASFDSSQGINTRTMQRYGISPTDGAFAASQSQYGLGRAMGEVNADNTARMDAKNEQFSRLASFENIGNKQEAQANDIINHGSTALGGAYGGQMNMYGNQANQYNQAAAAGASGMGKFAGMIGNGMSSSSGGSTDGFNMANTFGGQT